MDNKDFKSFREAYNSIYEQQYEVFGGRRYTVMPNGTLTYPVDKRTEPTPDEIKTLTRPLNTSAAKPAPTPPTVEKPAPTPPTVEKPASIPTSPSVPAPKKTFRQELDDLRKASAQATMAGPSKESQALMSTRTKNILGSEKLKTGIESQQKVEKMKSEIGIYK